MDTTGRLNVVLLSSFLHFYFSYFLSSIHICFSRPLLGGEKKERLLWCGDGTVSQGSGCGYKMNPIGIPSDMPPIAEVSVGMKYGLILASM